MILCFSPRIKCTTLLTLPLYAISFGKWSGCYPTRITHVTAYLGNRTASLSRAPHINCSSIPSRQPKKNAKLGIFAVEYYKEARIMGNSIRTISIAPLVVFCKRYSRISPVSLSTFSTVFSTSEKSTSINSPVPVFSAAAASDCALASFKSTL